MFHMSEWPFINPLKQPKLQWDIRSILIHLYYASVYSFFFCYGKYMSVQHSMQIQGWTEARSKWRQFHFTHYIFKLFCYVIFVKIRATSLNGQCAFICTQFLVEIVDHLGAHFSILSSGHTKSYFGCYLGLTRISETLFKMLKTHDKTLFNVCFIYCVFVYK